MAELPTLYEYYTEGGITAGLSANQTYFTLNNKNITLYSGALHYFRVPQEYWRDRLRKMRAAGLNAVETYVPWNLHEPEPGVYDFGQGGTDFQELLDVQKFLQIAQEEDLLAIVRPGPYICSEWELGGMPSWLLREKDMKLRTSDALFMAHVQRYFGALLSLFTMLQFSVGGPIIAFQIENEYGNTKVDNEPVDTAYLEALKQLFLDNGITELLFTSDTPLNGNSGSLPGVLYTANFQFGAELQLTMLKSYQPDKPLMVMEYWTGWFDHWTEEHHTRSNEDFLKELDAILKFPSSVNFYMFHGGTNWGFLNGANIAGSSSVDNDGYQPDTSSYDYDAPLTEAGDYTDKYYGAKEMIANYSTVKTKLPDVPALIPRVAYPTVQITQYLDFKGIIDNAPIRIFSDGLVSMEELPNINNGTGQQYGYIVYRKTGVDIAANSILKVGGRVCDSLMVLINGQLRSKVLAAEEDLNGFGYWRLKDATLNLGSESYTNATLELVVENWGRNNYGKLTQFDQRKGLWQGPVTINDAELSDWEIVPLEFKKKWTNALQGWKTFDGWANIGPGIFKAILTVDSLNDTFIDCRDWTKGIVIVNGFVLSRYLRIGPQQTAYLPAPFLKVGDNEILFLEHFTPAGSVKFSTDAIFETMKSKTTVELDKILDALD